jgi:opacity protein-like surface antigen
MNTLKGKTLTTSMAGALMCLAAPNLLAQDVPGTWYLGLDTGVALQQDITLENSRTMKLSFDPGFRLDVSGGVHLSQSWKAEVALGFIYNPGGEYVTFLGDVPDYFQVPIMANAIYTVPLKGRFSVHVGAGVGGVCSVISYHVFDAETGFTFGYQGIVGVKYALKDNLDLGLSYKLLGTIEQDLGLYRADVTLSHSLLAALTFKF